MFPQLLHIGRFALPTYGFLVAIGVLVGLYFAGKLAASQGIDPDKAWNLGVIAILSGVLGAKVLLVIVDFSYYAAHPGEIFSIGMLQAGGVFSGGLIAAVLLSLWYMRREHMPMLGTCDAFAPGLALGHAIGRLGCFSAGCCFGTPTNLPWGVTFTNPLAQSISGTPLGVKLHPTELYESLAELINFVLLYTLFRKRRFDGQVIGAYMFLYGVERFFLEFLRGDPDRGSVFGGLMSGTQLIALLLVLAGGAIWVWKRSPRPAAQLSQRRAIGN